MNKEDEKLRKHLVDEMMKVSQTNPDVMYYMEVLMKSYEELEQKNIDLSQQLLSKKISDKDIEYKKRMEIQQELDKYKNIIDELEKVLNYDINKSTEYMNRFIGEEQGNYPVHYYRAEWQKEKAIGYLDKLKELKGSDE